MSEVVAEALRTRAAAEPDRPFVKCGGEWVTLRELDERTDRVAAGLAGRGVAAGDRVALIVPNRQEMVELFFACAKLGAVQVPLNVWLKGDFLQYQLADCGADVLIADDAGFRSAESLLASTGITKVFLLDTPDGNAAEREQGAGGVAEVSTYGALLACTDPVPDVDIAAGDLFAILYTSGTTGMPKGCMIPNGYYWGNARTNGDAGWVGPDDRLFTAFPLFHMSGHHVLIASLVNEASLCVEPEFHAGEFLDRAAQEDATVLFGVGPMGMAILMQPPSEGDGEHPFRLAMMTPMPEPLQLAFEERFKTPVIAEGYGQTECSPATLSPVVGDRRRSTVGRPVAHIDLRVVDDDDGELPAGEIGEIVLRPREPNRIFQGYWNKPDATAEASRNLWHHTGDSGVIDDDGFVTFVDRKKDALRRRGENVSSLQLEAAITQHPKVAQVAVTAVPSPLGEDDVKATIVAVPSEELTPDELFSTFEESLPYFAIPRYVEVRDELPVNALGRIMKHILRDEGVTPTTWDLDEMGFAVARGDRRGG